MPTRLPEIRDFGKLDTLLQTAPSPYRSPELIGKTKDPVENSKVNLYEDNSERAELTKVMNEKAIKTNVELEN
ncbi:2131_t:CDS:2 [Entrophospora sp. SA101]|nr:2131_t:CDS:2 [Entrophospora sp. SA101]